MNYQNNKIELISNLENLPQLIFLDFYNNDLQSLDGPLPSVTGENLIDEACGSSNCQIIKCADESICIDVEIECTLKSLIYDTNLMRRLPCSLQD